MGNIIRLRNSYLSDSDLEQMWHEDMESEFNDGYSIVGDDYTRYTRIHWKYHRVDVLVVDNNKAEVNNVFDYKSISNMFNQQPCVMYVSRELESKGIAVLCSRNSSVNKPPKVGLMYRGNLVECYRCPLVFVAVDSDNNIVSLSVEQLQYITANLKINKSMFCRNLNNKLFSISVYDV